MRIIGIITTSLVALLAIFGILLGLRSVPDVRRYFRIRSM
jgi:hypothetical protein